MRVEEVNFPLKDDGDGELVAEGSLDCPKCGLPWAHASGGSADIAVATKCPHLRFVVGPAEMEHHFNGMTEDRLVAAVVRAYLLLHAEAQEWTPEEAYSEALFDNDFWESATMGEIDSIFEESGSGAACGPVSYTVLFGAKLDG